MKFAVVTEVDREHNYCNEVAVKLKSSVSGYLRIVDSDADYEEVDESRVIEVPVFFVGEILILDEDGREPGYPGRKPSKWAVKIECYDQVEEAVKRVNQVLEV